MTTTVETPFWSILGEGMNRVLRDRKKAAEEITDALRLAGAQARAVARATGTPMVRARNGEIVEVYLDPDSSETVLRRPVQKGMRLPKVSNLF